MKALLDTNIVIHRENTQPSNYSIGRLFFWLDKLNYDKCIHAFTVTELRKLDNSDIQSLYDAKLSAYTKLMTNAPKTPDFSSKLGAAPKTQNDEIDNQLLCEVYSGRVDILITEDRRMRSKASSLGIDSRVFSINTFIAKCIVENPDLLDYKMLSVRKEFLGNITLSNPFFNSLRTSYNEFDDWFAKKSNEEAYICKSDNEDILGFLYLKTEHKSEDYSDINPPLSPKKRLKIGTFKVEATGFRLGERFIKIIFDNAIERQVEEIYVTIHEGNGDTDALVDLLLRWGFHKHGQKGFGQNAETVMIKSLGHYNASNTPKENFPTLIYDKQKLIVPILPQYHTSLLPDSKLDTENRIDFLGKEPQRYALQKVYISKTFKRDMYPGDLVLFYRQGEPHENKKFKSVLTTVAIIDEIHSDFQSKGDFFSTCENRSVFTKDELEHLWNSRKNNNLVVVKFIFVKSLGKRLTLGYLWDNNIIQPPGGPRPFTKITDQQFEQILTDSNTKINVER